MRKRSIFVIIAVIALLIITGCSYEEKEKITDASKFKGEYESINGNKIDGSDNAVRSLDIPLDNPFVYATSNDIISMMDNNETFVVYFGFSNCPWCRSILPTLIDTAKDLKLKKIYYVDVKNIRDQLSVSEDGKVVTTKEGSEGYLGLLARLDNVLEEYTLYADGKEIKTGEKRIYAPNVVSIVNGKAKELSTGISDKQTDAYMEITEEMRQDTYKMLECVIKCATEDSNVCTQPHAC